MIVRAMRCALLLVTLLVPAVASYGDSVVTSLTISLRGFSVESDGTAEYFLVLGSGSLSGSHYINDGGAGTVASASFSDTMRYSGTVAAGTIYEHCYRAYISATGNYGATQSQMSGQICAPAQCSTSTGDYRAYCGPDDDPLNDDCSSTPQSCSPLILDLNGDGVRTTGASRPVRFDIDADGDRDLITWTDPSTHEAFLWLDLNPNNTVDDGSELFGSGTVLPNRKKAKNGFEALAVYDRIEEGGNGDGKITSDDRIWGRLRLWVDRNHDGIAQTGETDTIHRFAVVELHLDYVTDEGADENGNRHLLRGTYGERLLQRGGAPTINPQQMDDVYFFTVPATPAVASAH